MTAQTGRLQGARCPFPGAGGVAAEEVQTKGCAVFLDLYKRRRAARCGKNAVIRC